ncbi:hypothetical protein GCM10011428_39430 [Streptomyces violaceus]|uniref:hypothetical protein n=1 Tax=Streptomyces violaceus TaxID=1936 RepID=UPI0031F02E02
MLDARSAPLTVVLVGDGECETGTTAAAWLAARALSGTGEHGTVLPVVLLNGQRMGGPSILSTLSHAELTAYFTGLGHRPVYADGRDIPALRRALVETLDAARPLGTPEPSSVLVLTLDKGHGAPDHVEGKPVARTPAVHKTPCATQLPAPPSWPHWPTGWPPTSPASS